MDERYWEQRARDLIAEIPREQRESDPAFQPSHGYPDEVRVEAIEHGILISSFRKEWRLPSLPVDTWVPHVVVRWADLDDAGDDLLRDALHDVRRKRIRSYQRCSYCQGIIAPETMFDPTACMGCASEHLGVDF